VLDETGAVSRLVGTAEDVTEAREVENRLRQAQRLDSIGTLTGGIAHDFNNILAGIMGFSALAEQSVGQAEINRDELKSSLSNINRAAHRAADLVAQILTFSRAGTIEYARVEMNQAVGEAIKLLRAAIPSYIEFKTQVSDHLPTIMGNASQLHQVVMNLGANAWHAMRDTKGRLVVSLDRCTMDEVQARLLSNVAAGEFVRLTVTDTGTGMSAATIERIFEPFFTTKPSGQGTGLGLSVVHGIVRSHRGAIKVSSEVGRGTTVEVFLPVLVESSTPVERTPIAVTTTRGSGQHVLFIDDEPALVHLGERALGRLGYRVTGAHSATAALELLKQAPNQFDLIVTDQTMPGMTGLEFATRARLLWPAMPIVLVSGYMAGITEEQLKAAGICEAVDKPYSNDLLASIIHRQLAPK
jgi:nitrogen-specific signal transduction histidine kinase/ActR/RegA family two-component response regulator